MFQKNNKIQNGDIVIGYDNKKYGKKPTVIKFKDRFSHTLILGDSGCSKIQNTVIPMVNQDLQNPNTGVIVIESNGELAEKVFELSKQNSREIIYFNPISANSAIFNPLGGNTADAMSRFINLFKLTHPDSSKFHLNENINLIIKSIEILKRLKGDNATLTDLDNLLNDCDGKGRKILEELSKSKGLNPVMAKDNLELIEWFLDDYYSGLSGEGTKTFEHTISFRKQINLLANNEYTKKVLIPPKNSNYQLLDFNKILEDGVAVSITTARGHLRELGVYLGHLIVSELENCVFERPGSDATRRSCMVYMDEFELHLTPDLIHLATQGRAYRVALHMISSSRESIYFRGHYDGSNKELATNIECNLRNKIIYPVSPIDTQYYFEIFNDELSQNDIDSMEHGEFMYCILENNSYQKPGISKALKLEDTIKIK